MEKMDLDDNVVDLSISNRRDPSLTITPATVRDLRALTTSGLTITPAPSSVYRTDATANSTSNSTNNNSLSVTATATSNITELNPRNNLNNRRVLRPRTEPRSYAETPDIVLLPAKVNGNSRNMSNGNYDSDSDDCELPLSYPIKELTPAEIQERDQCIRKLKEELRGEETKLVLLKKLKQSQQLKDGITVLPANTTLTPAQPGSTHLLSNKSSLSVTPAIGNNLPGLSQQPQPAHLRSSKPATVLKGQPLPGRGNTTVLSSPRSSLPGGATLTPGPAHRSSSGQSQLGRPANITITPSVTITPTNAPPVQQSNKLKNSHNDRSRDDGQTPAQRQAAAKLALRKQLEKTLLQIPPPKPPPPEMHFIPNPSNTEFVYLLGLEHVVDFITKERKSPPAPEPFKCQQCRSDFTPVWKWEKQGKHRPANATFQNPQGKDPRVICEQCVTSNVKKALKAEHTNRLKTAFVKALQQEQEIEQRLTTSGGSNNSSSLSNSNNISSSSHQSNSGNLVHHHQSHHNRSSPSPSTLSVLPPGVTATVIEPTQNPSSLGLPNSSSTKSSNSSGAHRHAPTPPARHTPPPSTSSRSRHSAASLEAANLDKAFLSQSHLGALSSLASLGGLGNLASLGNLSNLGNLANLNNTSSSQQQATMQALHNQLIRGMFSGLSQTGLSGNSSHMLPFQQLLYPYQLAIAQAAGLGKSGVPNLADMQRAAELQRQYLLDMIPPQSSSNQRQNNWKT